MAASDPTSLPSWLDLPMAFDSAEMVLVCL